MGGKKSIKNVLLNKKNNLMNVKKERPIFFIWKFIIGIIIIIFSLIVGYQLFTNTESISQLIHRTKKGKKKALSKRALKKSS